MKSYFAGYGAAALFMLACMASGCGHFDKNLYEKSFTTLQQGATQYMDKGQHEEVVYITRALLDAEPDNREVQSLQDDAIAAQPSAAILVEKSILGSNLTDRVADEKFPLWGSVLLYIPNRALDLLDLVTVEVGLCFGIGAKVQATDFVSIGAQASAGETLIGLNRRHLSARASVEEFVHLLPFGAGFLGETRAYTGGSYGIATSQAGIKSPTDSTYQRARDFWAVGAQAEAVSVAATVQLHTMEIFDFLAGFVFYDPLKDDLGSTRPIHIQITENESQALYDLAYEVRYR